MSWGHLPNASHTAKPRLRFVGILLATLVSVALTSSLGFWQLRRAAAKEDWQAQMAQRAEMAWVDGASLGQAADSADNGPVWFTDASACKVSGWPIRLCFWTIAR